MWAPRGPWSSSVCGPRGPATEPGSQRSSEVFAESIASQAEESGRGSWTAICRPKPFISFNPPNSHMTYTSSSTFPKSEDCHMTRGGGAKLWTQSLHVQLPHWSQTFVEWVWTGAAFLRGTSALYRNSFTNAHTLNSRERITDMPKGLSTPLFVQGLHSGELIF